MLRKAGIPGLLLWTPRRHKDARGTFFEAWRRDTWLNAGVRDEFVQDNQSLSTELHVVRGLHFQTPPHGQAKLVRCIRGAVIDVAVDLRVGSPTYGQHFATRLDPDNGVQMFIPVGFAHGFCTLEPHTEILYKCSDYYSPESDAGLAFDDPDLGISWPVTRDAAALSPKDQRLPNFAGWRSPFRYSTEAVT